MVGHVHPASIEPFVRLDPAAVNDRPHRAEWKNAASMLSDDHLLASDRMTPLLMAAGTADRSNRFCRRTLITWSEVSLGVPRSPNRHLDELGILRQVEVGRLEVKTNRVFNVLMRLYFGVSG
jgi:hypothetical protein